MPSGAPWQGWGTVPGWGAGPGRGAVLGPGCGAGPRSSAGGRPTSHSSTLALVPTLAGAQGAISRLPFPLGVFLT